MDDDHDYGACHHPLSSLYNDTSCHLQCHIIDIVINRFWLNQQVGEGRISIPLTWAMSATNTPALATERGPRGEAHPLENVILPVAAVADATGGGRAAASEPAEPPATPQADPEQSPE